MFGNVRKATLTLLPPCSEALAVGVGGNGRDRPVRGSCWQLQGTSRSPLPHFEPLADKGVVQWPQGPK